MDEAKRDVRKSKSRCDVEAEPSASDTSPSGDRIAPMNATNRWREFALSIPTLVKAPLTLMAAFPAACAYLLSDPPASFTRFALFLAGTLLAGFGAAALNQWSERSQDAAMERTRHRPLPSGRVRPGHGLVFGLFLSIAGTVLLLVWFPPLAAAFAAGTVLLYWLVYTPLKRRTPYCTEVGAVAGALPTLIGAAAAGGSVTPIGWNLFLILFLWQMPHFHPIAWRYRRDYAAGGFRMLAVEDDTGRKTGLHALVYASLLTAAVFGPLLFGAGPVYAIAALLASGLFLVATLAFLQPGRREVSAPRLFRVSLIHLTLVLSGLLLDHGLSRLAG